MTSELKPIPLDENGLQRIEDAMKGAYTLDEETGEPTLKEGEFTLSQLLEWYSEYDESKLEEVAQIGPIRIVNYTGEMYSVPDLIQALIDELRIARHVAGLGPAPKPKRKGLGRLFFGDS